MKTETELFLDILYEISSGKVRLKATDRVGAIFERGLGPIEFELALYSLEATTSREIVEALYAGVIEDQVDKRIDDFLSEHLSKTPVQDPMFITKVFKKFHTSAKWENEEQNEPGKN